jgi:hypothetical protein
MHIQECGRDDLSAIALATAEAFGVVGFSPYRSSTFLTVAEPYIFTPLVDALSRFALPSKN